MSLKRLNADQTYKNDGNILIDNYIIPPNADLIIVNLGISSDKLVQKVSVSIDNNQLSHLDTVTNNNNDTIITNSVFYLLKNLFSPGNAVLNITVTLVDPNAFVGFVAIIQSYANVDISNPFASSQSQIFNGNEGLGKVNIPAPDPKLLYNQIVIDTFATSTGYSFLKVSPPDTVVYQKIIENNNSGQIGKLFQRNFSDNIQNADQKYTYRYLWANFPFFAIISYVINGTRSPICVVGNTKVTMADGTKKEIWNIQRGDLVFTNESNGQISPVAEATKIYVGPDVKLKMVRIQKGALGKNMPNKELILTGSHPIVWNGVRKRAHCFKDLSGVTYYPAIKAKDILPADENGHHFLYDLIFEDNLYYIANGIQVQAHSPECIHGLLPESQYFHKEKIGHVIDYVHPMDNTLVKKIKIKN